MEITFEKDADSILKTWNIYIPTEIKEQFALEISKLAEQNKKVMIIIKNKEE